METPPKTPASASAFSEPVDDLDNYDCPGDYADDTDAENSSNPETATEPIPSVFAWKLSPSVKESIYVKKNFKCRERVDKRLVYGFIANNMGISFRGHHKNDWLSEKWETELDMIKDYKEKLDRDGFETGEFWTSYHLAGHKWGRILPASNLSLSIFHRPTRHRFARDAYIDIDMINAQPSAVSEICRMNNHPCPLLDKYVADPLKLRQKIMKFHNCSKDNAKRLILRLLFGGNYDVWKKENGIETNKDKQLASVSNMVEEIKTIMNIVYEANKHIETDVLKQDKTKWKTVNEKRRGVMGLWSQTVERLIQETAINYLVKEKKFNLADIVPSQDGFMILKELWYDGLLRDIGNVVKGTYCIDMNWLDKPFDEAIEIPMYEGDKSYLEWEASVSSKQMADTFLTELGRNVVRNNGSLYVFYREKKTHNIYKNEAGEEVKDESNKNNTELGRWYDETSKKERNKLTIMVSEDLYEINDTNIRKAVELSKDELDNMLKINRRMTSSISNIQEIIIHIITRARQADKDFNSDPFLLGFENGLYDLMKNEFRKYTYTDYITLSTKYDYNKPNYTDEKVKKLREDLEAVISAIHPNADKKKLMYETLASGLDGRLYQKLFLFNGGGGNGKGLIASLMSIILGSYYHQVNSGVIKDMDASEKANAPSPDIANLQHRRFLLFEEIGTKNGNAISSAMMKKLTGGGDITGRFLGCDPIVFQLASTIVMYFNEEPDFDGEMGDAEARRFVDLFFEVNFTTDEEKIGKTEGKITWKKGNPFYETMTWKMSVRDIFLDILLDKYAKNLNKEGRKDEEKELGIVFTIPECVKRATKEFMKNQNAFIPIVDELFLNVPVVAEGKKIIIKENENSITIKDMWSDVSNTSEYKELSYSRKRTYNEKAFKKWVINKYHTTTPKDRGLYVLGVIRKPYQEKGGDIEVEEEE